MVVFFACANPFTTREPQPPQKTVSNYIPPITPEMVFDNMRFAILERNAENYMRSFVDTTRSEKKFEFVPDQGVAAANPGVFQNWSLSEERLYITLLFQATPADSLHELRFDEPRVEEGATTATFTQNYQLIMLHTRQGEGIPVLVKGQAKFWLEKNHTGDWAIYRWEDFTNGVDATWSKLKALIF